jgi:hypothetical protein
VGAVLDLAGDQRRAPEQAREQGQEPQQDPNHAAVPEAAGELPGPVLAGSDPIVGLIGVGTQALVDELDPCRRGQAVVEAGLVERVVHLQAGRDQDRRQRGQRQQREQRLLAVLAPHQPGHGRTSRWSLWTAGPGRAPADGSAR